VPLPSELGALLAKDLKTALQIVLDQFELLGRIAGGVLERGGSEAFVEAADSLQGLQAWADKDFATVDGVAIAFDEAGFFKAVEDAGDGTGGQTGGAGEVSGGERSLRITGHQFKASGISNIEAQFTGDGLVKKDGGGAELAAEFHPDAKDQSIAFAGRSRSWQLCGAI